MKALCIKIVNITRLEPDSYRVGSLKISMKIKIISKVKITINSEEEITKIENLTGPKNEICGKQIGSIKYITLPNDQNNLIDFLMLNIREDETWTFFSPDAPNIKDYVIENDDNLVFKGMMYLGEKEQKIFNEIREIGLLVTTSTLWNKNCKDRSFDDILSYLETFRKPSQNYPLRTRIYNQDRVKSYNEQEYWKTLIDNRYNQVKDIKKILTNNGFNYSNFKELLDINSLYKGFLVFSFTKGQIDIFRHFFPDETKVMPDECNGYNPNDNIDSSGKYLGKYSIQNVSKSEADAIESGNGGNLLNTIINSNTWEELENAYNSITNETLFKNDSAFAKSVEREVINTLKKLINKTNNLSELETLKNNYSSKILTEYQNEVNTAYQEKRQQLTEDQENSFLMAISQSQDWKTLKSTIKKAQDNLTSSDNQAKIKVRFISVLEKIINSINDKDKLETLKTDYQSDSYFQALASSDQTKINNVYDTRKQQLETSIPGNNNQGQDNNSNIMPWVIGISMSLLGICLVTVLYRFYRKRKIQK